MNRFLVSIAAADSISQAAEVCQISDNFFAPLKALPNVHQTLYAQVPPLSENDFSVSECACNSDGTFRCKYRNFGLVQGYLPSYLSLCGLKEAYWCPEIANGTCDFSGREISVYHSDRPTETSLTWGAVNFDGTAVIAIESASQPVYVKSNIGTLEFFRMRHVLPAGVTAQDLEAAFLEANPRFPSADKMNEFCRGEWFPHAEECFGTESEALAAMEDSLERCALSAGIGDFDHEFSDDRGWCVSGICEPGEFPSSSSGAESSSSAFTNRCLRHPLKSIPSDPQNSCFSFGGKCYRCNPARGESCSAEWLWTADFDAANVGWWLVEVDCATGEAAERERLGACEVHPFSSVPADPEKACFAADGQCFRCTPDRGSECENEWLWIYAFNPANVGWWYTPVSCENPDGDAEGKCPDGISIAYKRLSSGTESEEEEIFEYRNSRYFDAKGRERKFPSWKYPTFLKQGKTFSAEKSRTLNQKIDAILSQVGLKKSNIKLESKCGLLGTDYGFIGQTGLIGGVTCPYVGTYYTPGKRIGDSKEIGFCDDGSKLIEVRVQATFFSELISTNQYIVPIGYEFENGYSVTKEDFAKLVKHENGHAEDFKCIGEKFANETEIRENLFCVCEKDLASAFEEWAESLRVKKWELDAKRFKAAEIRYHQKYSPFDAPEGTYACPEDL